MSAFTLYLFVPIYLFYESFLRSGVHPAFLHPVLNYSFLSYSDFRALSKSFLQISNDVKRSP